ncbi:MAG: hypothetical protein JJE51_12000 [Thermoanaerobaculia bacterium]|nr:hypothetical protein [Thermoanaerobaculia bacterium]
MRWFIWLLLVVGWGFPPPREQKSADTAPAFESTVQPILTRRCQPCHFPGGKMHAKLPFDKAATVDKLGTRLFSRIKDEEDRAVIRKFLARVDKGQS